MSLSKLLATMINRVQGIDYLIFSIVPRGKERRRVERDRNNRCRMSSTIASIAIFFPSLSSFYFSSLSNFLPFLPPPIFLFSSVPSPRFIHPLPLQLLFSIPHFPPARIGFVSSPRDFNCQFNGVPVLFFFPSSRAHRGQWWISTIHGKWKCIFRAFLCVYIYVCVCDKRDTRFRFGETMGQGRGQRTFCYCFQLDFFTGLAGLIYSRLSRRDFFLFYLNSNRNSLVFGDR